jgi:hypothetical protein
MEQFKRSPRREPETPYASSASALQVAYHGVPNSSSNAASVRAMVRGAPVPSRPKPAFRALMK